MKKITAFLLILLLSLTMLPTMAIYAGDPVFDDSLSDKPTGVVGRVLTPDKTGDIVEWIEIARNGKYSLIIRKEFLTIYPNKIMSGKDVSRDYKWQYTNSYGTEADYMTSVVRTNINKWFNGEPYGENYPYIGEHDKLPENARLRAFTMQVHPQITPGTGTRVASLSDGFSRPSKYQVGVGDDIAFALSYCESANFMSRRMVVRDRYITASGKQVNDPEPASSDLAIANYNRMVFPTMTDARYGIWLRNPGDITGTVGVLDAAPPNPSQDGAGMGRVFQEYYNSTTFRGYIYPACWVDQEIFTNSTKAPPAPVTIVPTGVNGRILTPEMTGDNASWIEIAQCGDSSLIVRQEFLTIYPNKIMYGNDVSRDYKWQYSNTFGIEANYMTSVVRGYINKWFNVEPCGETYPYFGEHDTLPFNARLRDYTVQATTKYYLGTASTTKGLTDGLSRPTNYQCGIGNDVAFTLSYSESANFLSRRMFVRDHYTTVSGRQVSDPEQTSSDLAIENYNRMVFPTMTDARWGIWLRSFGDIKDYVGILDAAPNDPVKGGLGMGRAFQAQFNSATFRCYVYPALWVDPGIFVGGHTVKGKVWPMVSEDLWNIGDTFLKAHDVVVELRSTFNTPAPAGLSTKAVLKDGTGLGEFTFSGVPDGDYVLYIKRPGYLTRAMKVTISGAIGSTITLEPPGTTEGGVFKLLWGDCTDDLRIDNDDVLMVLEMIANNVNAFSPLYNAACDFNADGLIDNEDILMIIEMWNKIARVYPGAGDVNFYE